MRPASESLGAQLSLVGNGFFRFQPITPLTGDAACLDEGAITRDPADEVFQLPSGLTRTVITRRSDIATSNAEVNFDTLTLNETGPQAGRQAGRFLNRTHEVSPSAGLSVTDLRTGTNALVAERTDRERSMASSGHRAARS